MTFRKRRDRRLSSPALVTALLAAMCGAVAVSVGSTAARAASPLLAFQRLAGGTNNSLSADRFGTAAAVAEEAFPGGANTALIATGLNFPDALAGAYLAGSQGAPILLVNPSDPVPPATLSALKALKTKDVTILGGTSAVGKDVQSTLAATPSAASAGGNLVVTRIAGATRYDTMLAIDSQPGEPVGTDNGSPTAILATGQNFPDALAAASLSYGKHFPLILTDGSAPTMSPQAQAVLADDHIGHLIVVGGPSAIDPSQYDDLAISVDTAPTDGQDRSQTSYVLAEDEVANYGVSPDHFDIADGYDPSASGSPGMPAGFTPDALAGAPYGGLQGAPTLVTDSPTDAGSVPRFASDFSKSVQNADVFGGTAAVADSVLSGVASAAGSSYPSKDNFVSVAAAPQAIEANPGVVAGQKAATSTLTATVDSSSGKPVSGDSVTFSTAPAPGSSGSCGSLSSSSATTSSSGQASVTYTASGSVGGCVISAQEAKTSSAGAATLLQTPILTETLSASPAKVGAGTTATSAITATVDNTTQDNLGQSGDTVSFSVMPVLGTTCGSVSPTSATTSTQGQASTTYSAGSGPGFCLVVGHESDDGVTAWALIDQTNGSGSYSTSASASPTSVPADGSSTSTVTVVVANGNTPVPGDLVEVTTSGTCGAAYPSFGETDSTGRVILTYQAASSTGSCTLSATEADTASSGSTSVGQQ